MGLYLENGYTSLNKKGEELCGDKVECVVRGDYTTIVLADGMGSGVGNSLYDGVERNSGRRVHRYDYSNFACV